MQTQLLTPGDIPEAARLLRAGELVIIPTETVYGLAANALDPQAVANIFVAKGRPQDNPLIVHISDLEMAMPLVEEFPAKAQLLAQKFWPGSLTIILKKTPAIPSVTSGGLETVALRMPAHGVARQIIAEAGVPLAAPSANRSGSPSPTTAQHCVQDMNGRVAAIVDAGACDVGVESTVISLAGPVPVLLRPGAVTPEQLREVLGELELHHSILSQLDASEQAGSPGMKYKHYAPKAQVTIVEGTTEQYARFLKLHAGSGDFALCFEEDIPNLPPMPYVVYGSAQDSLSQARRLFDALRELDKLGAQQAFAHASGKDGLGLAVYNRLLRAAAFRVMNAE